MTRLAPWLGSLLVHGTLVAAATQCRHEQAARMEIVDAELVFPEIAEAPVAADREEAVEDVAEAVGPPTMEAPKPVREAAQTARRPREAASASESMAAEAPAPPAAQLPPWQGLDAENGLLAGALGTDGTGRAGGAGRAGAIAGSGSGTGPGRGEQRSGRPVVPVRRAAARSRARPPRLVYPVRDREERPGEVFVARLTINEGGYVVGARLEHGVDPYRDRKAMEAVWRFHYAPALDRAGRPVRAQVLQRFMVE
jgi:hypothetical protein